MTANKYINLFPKNTIFFFSYDFYYRITLSHYHFITPQYVNSAVSTATAAIQTPNTYYYLLAGKETWEYTWYNFADISLWSDYGINKSIYDPCPYGYRVPNNGSWTGFPSTKWIINTLNEGVVWRGLWWPAAGARTDASGPLGYVGNRGYYWSSARYSVAYHSYRLAFDYIGAVNPSTADYRGYGCSVRCVQERAIKR